MDVGLGTSFVATAIALIIQVMIVVGVLALLRPLFIWLFGVNEILAELRALRGDTRQNTQRREPSNAPAPMFNPDQPRERTVGAQGWGDAQSDAESAAKRMRYVD